MTKRPVGKTAIRPTITDSMRDESQSAAPGAGYESLKGQPPQTAAPSRVHFREIHRAGVRLSHTVTKHRYFQDPPLQIKGRKSAKTPVIPWETADFTPFYVPGRTFETTEKASHAGDENASAFFMPFLPKIAKSTGLSLPHERGRIRWSNLKKWIWMNSSPDACSGSARCAGKRSGKRKPAGPGNSALIPAGAGTGRPIRNRSIGIPTMSRSARSVAGRFLPSMKTKGREDIAAGPVPTGVGR